MKVFFSITSSTIGRLSIETQRNSLWSHTDFSRISFRILKVDVLRLIVPSKRTVSARNKQKLALYGCFAFWSKIKQLTWWLFWSGSGITESGHHLGTFLSKAAKMVTFLINLNCHLVFRLSFVPKILLLGLVLNSRQVCFSTKPKAA